MTDKPLDHSSRLFIVAWAAIAVFIISNGSGLLMGYTLFNFASTGSLKVLLQDNEVHMPEALRWEDRARFWLPETSKNDGVILALLTIDDCNNELKSVLNEMTSELLSRIALEGRCSWLEGNKQRAVDIWKGNGVEPYLYNLAVYDQVVGRVDRSKENYEALLAVDPTSVAGWLGIGLLYEEESHWVEAEMAYEEAIRLEPNNPLVHKAMAYYRWRRALGGERTENELKKAIELAFEPPKLEYRDWSSDVGSFRLNLHIRTIILDLPHLYSRLAGLYVWTDRYPLAEETARKAIALDPNLAWAYHFLGDALRLQGKMDEAITVYQKALTLEKTSLWLNYGLAIAFMEVGDFTSARREAHYLVSQDPQELRFRSLYDEIEEKKTSP